MTLCPPDAKEAKSSATPGCNRIKIGIAGDTILIVGLLAFSILAIIGHVNQIETLRSLYPIGAYAPLGVACAMGLVGLAIYLSKRKDHTFDASIVASKSQTSYAIKNEIEHNVYKLGILDDAADEDPIFNPLQNVDVKQFDCVAKQWLQLPWIKELDSSLQRKFVQFLENLNKLSIPRQNEVFTNKHSQLKAYDLFKKGIIHLYSHVEKNNELGKHVVLQLIVAVDECPLTYYSSITTALHAVAGKEDQAGKVDVIFKRSIHQLYAQFRKEIVDRLACYHGRKETHTAHSIISVIGNERKIPGYRFTIEDKQADLKSSDRVKLLEEYDKCLSVSSLTGWFLLKVNGMKDGKCYLHNVIPDYLAWHFDISIDIVREVIYDEDYHLTYDSIAASLELLGILEPLKGKENQTSAAILEQAFKEKVKEKYKIEEQHSPIAFSSWEEIPLSKLLILSDGFFYDLSANGDDLIYLQQQLIENGSRKTPKNTFYNDEDCRKFMEKISRLKLSSTEVRRKEVFSQIEIADEIEPPPYRSLENLIADLIETAPNGDFESAITPYLDALQHPKIQQLKLPDYGNQQLMNINFYRLNMHVFAIYLWNALMQTDYSASPPPKALMGAALYHGITLKRKVI